MASGNPSTASSEENVPDKPARSHIILITTFIMLVDLLFYGSLIPLIAVYLAGSCTMLGASPPWETVLTIFFAFSLLYLSFSLCGESHYWKHLFAFEEYYEGILKLRDVVNTFLLIVCLAGLASSVEAIVDDRSMKKNYLSEGVSYVFVKTILSWLWIDYERVLPSLGLTLPHAASLTDPNFGENERFEHAGSYMLLWAMLTACVAKLVYFNTLFTYLRAMTIFISLRPSFEDDDDDETDDDEMDDKAS